ncbi:TnpV protein [Eubacterium ventriosum]|jgi:hypothetical protein|uniref:TnpV protein n=1 Tax=Eubacterium ventriosum TaxID=39496 RepID=UPI00399AD51D
MTMMKLGFKQKERYGYGEDGIYYPKILFETEESEKIQLGRWGREWINFLKTEHSYRYSKLRRESQLKVVAHEVETEANEMLERLEKEYYEKHCDECNGFMETCRIREQARMMAEEIVRHEIIYKIR